MLVITRFDFPFLAARGYIDIPYLALVIWAAVLEAARPRAAAPVLVLLALAGLLRPEAWLLAGLYCLWLAWRATWPRRIGYAALAAIGPAGLGRGPTSSVTGDPLYSLTDDELSAEELGRTRALAAVPAATWRSSSSSSRSSRCSSARSRRSCSRSCSSRAALTMPVVLFASGVGTFALVGAGGLSVIARYLLVAVARA